MSPPPVRRSLNVYHTRIRRCLDKQSIAVPARSFDGEALKGRDRLSRPFRAWHVNDGLIPAALPQAFACRPFGAFQTAANQTASKARAAVYFGCGCASGTSRTMGSTV